MTIFRILPCRWCWLKAGWTAGRAPYAIARCADEPAAAQQSLPGASVIAALPDHRRMTASRLLHNGMQPVYETGLQGQTAGLRFGDEHHLQGGRTRQCVDLDGVALRQQAHRAAVAH